MLDLSLKRMFVIGDTSTGKTTSTINQVLSAGIPIVYYITSKKVDLNDKEQYVRTHYFNDLHYDTLYHDSDRIISLNKKASHRFHLMTIEKALYYFLNNKLENDAVVILDEIDSISQNKNYELLVAWLNTNYPDNTIIYISATLNKEKLLKDLGDFFMLDKNNPNSIIDMGVFKRNVSTSFVHVSNYKKFVEKELVTYANNTLKFNQTIFLIPSKPYIRKLLNSDLIKSLYPFREPNAKLKKILSNVHKEHDLSNDVLLGLRHNIGIIDALSSHEDREFVLKLFNSKIINVLFATNVIERGINVLANTIMIFESRRVRWEDNQILNMFGRLNRRINGQITDKMGYFFLFSEYRSNYDFSKIYKRDYEIKSILKYSDVYFFYVLNNKIIEHLINKYDKNKFTAFEQYKQFADSIKFSLTIHDIRRVLREVLIFLNQTPNKMNFSNDRLLNSMVNKIGSGKTMFNFMRYLYIKAYNEYKSGKISHNDFVDKIKALARTYVDEDMKFGITNLYGQQLVKEEERIAEDLAKGKINLEEANSIFLFKKKSQT
jgi:late competence protein required for DNA uptake (superfamily II DNA/RNA helicase)